MDDTVSRRHVVDTIHRMRSICDTEDIDDYHDLMVEAVDVLPSVGCKYYRTDEDETGFRVIWCAAGKTQPNWIPCSQPPETDENVFIARGNENFMSCCIGHYDLDAETWYEDRNWFAQILYDALYWCKMPTLPET